MPALKTGIHGSYLEGMRQRVALLRTYLTHRELLLLDEPFGALDALTRLQMQQFLLDHWQEDQRTVVFITHDVDEALLLGDTVLVLAPRPTFVLATVEVGFKRPRNAEEILSDPEFVELKRELLTMLVNRDEPTVAAPGNGVVTNRVALGLEKSVHRLRPSES